MNSFGNTDIKTIENKEYTTIETEKANELIERLNKENILFYARYDEKKISLQFNRNDLDKINGIAAELAPPKAVDISKQPEKIPKEEVKAESAPVPEPTKDIPAEREKLIPLMETLTAHQESKIENAQTKVQSHLHKIGKNENKIARLQDRSQRLCNVTDFMKALSKSSSIPGIKHLVEAKIEKMNRRSLISMKIRSPYVRKKSQSIKQPLMFNEPTKSNDLTEKEFFALLGEPTTPETNPTEIKASEKKEDMWESIRGMGKADEIITALEAVGITSFTEFSGFM